MSPFEPPASPLDASRLVARLEALSRHTQEPGRMTRLYLSEAHRDAMQTAMGWMRDAGMRVHLDGAGNVVGRYEAARPQARTLLIGSHIDTVRDAGIYDGNLGVVVGIAIVADLHARGIRLPFAIEVIAFGDEEGVRFPTTLTGSRALGGRFNPAWLDERDSDGRTRAAGLDSLGCPVGEIATCARDPASILGYVEVHIEQGPVLETRSLPVGVVTAINGVSRGEIRVTGTAGHAGTLPMAMRHDALTAAAAMVLAVEARGRAEDGLVATVGTMTVANGAINTVAGSVSFSLDVRSADDGARLRAVADLRAQLDQIARGRGVDVAMDIAYEAPASPCDANLQQRLARVVEQAGLAPFFLPSGAGHDAMAFRGLWPIAMLFVRCRGGISHNPAEYATPEDIVLSARILSAFVQDLGENP